LKNEPDRKSVDLSIIGRGTRSAIMIKGNTLRPDLDVVKDEEDIIKSIGISSWFENYAETISGVRKVTQPVHLSPQTSLPPYTAGPPPPTFSSPSPSLTPKQTPLADLCPPPSAIQGPPRPVSFLTAPVDSHSLPPPTSRLLSSLDSSYNKTICLPLPQRESAGVPPTSHYLHSSCPFYEPTNSFPLLPFVSPLNFPSLPKPPALPPSPIPSAFPSPTTPLTR
jgi:hypothetical protein